MATKKQLVATAKELNEVLELDPKINLTQKVQGLENDITEAVDLIEEDDILSEETWEVINELVPDDEDDDEDDDAGEEEAAEEESDEAEVEEEAEEEEVEEEEAPVVEKGGVPTKKAIVEACLIKGATIEQIAQAIVDAGIDDDYEKNYRVAKAWLTKMGFDTKKAAIANNPIFKKKKE